MEISLTGRKIAVLKGGFGSERRISLASGEAVEQALSEAGAEVVPVDVEDENFVIPDSVDLAFNVIHGTFGEDGKIQQILEKMGIPYTGAGVKSSEIAFDKVLAKEVFIEKGIPTPKSEIIKKGEQPTLDMPYVIKPPREGSSVGIHIVTKQEEVEEALADGWKYDDELLIEEYISGKELTVGVLGGNALPIVHIAPEDGWYDINNKYPWLESKGKTQYFCPAELSEEQTKKVQETATKAHQALGIEIYSRVDILLDEKRGPYVLEINTLPGMTASSLLPKAASELGINFSQLCARIALDSMNCIRNQS